MHIFSELGGGGAPLVKAQVFVLRVCLARQTEVVLMPLRSAESAPNRWSKHSINKCFYFTFKEHPRYNITHGQNRTFFGYRTGPGDRPIQ